MKPFLRIASSTRPRRKSAPLGFLSGFKRAGDCISPANSALCAKDSAEAGTPK